MLITYMRSSSYSNFDFCQMQYFISYVLGIQRGTSTKALKGTATHKVLELLAKCKLVMQKEPNQVTHSMYDKEIGVKLEWHNSDMLSPTRLTNEEVEKINSTRINKQTYKDECDISYGHTRYGVEFVEKIIKIVNKHFGEAWAPVDFRDVGNWVWMTLDYNNGAFDPRRRSIVAAEPHFNYPIEREWAKFDWDLPGGEKITGNLGIKGTIDLITDVGDGILEIVDWKGLPLDTPIPTPDGWTTMEELKIGDIVFDINGKLTNVIGKSNITKKQCYKIQFDDTSEAICDCDHLWTLNTNEVKKVTDLKLNDKISITKPLDLEDIDLPIDPYVLGIWLGDGRNKNGEISCNDKQIIDEIISRGYELGPDISGKNKDCPQHTILGLRTILNNLDLLHNKHIPLIYLRASYNQRINLLRGLMDSDGNVNKARKQCIFTNCNKRLSEDVKELLLSLGQRPLLSHVLNKQFDKDIDIYPISFRPININPFLLLRKANQVDYSCGAGQSNIRRIVKLEEIKEMYTQCIAVDSSTNTYLCTKNMIPTHNSGQRLDWTSKKDNDIKTYEKLQQDFQLMLYHYAAKKMYPKAKQILVTIFFIRDGGPFTICFDERTLEQTEQKLRERFNEIKACTQPTMQDPTQNNFKCKYICDYFKTKAPDGNNLCRYIHDSILTLGIDHVTKEHTRKGFSIGHYEAPGEK